MTEPDLFGGTLKPRSTRHRPSKPSPPTTPDTPATRTNATAGGGTPRDAAAALADVHDHRLGVLDNTGRVVRLSDHEQVRRAHNDDVVTSLIRSGYVTEDEKNRVSCRHGAVRRPVVPLVLTRSGKALFDRWSALHGTGARRTD